jgi:membrane-bound ClpP family serine protease
LPEVGGKHKTGETGGFGQGMRPLFKAIILLLDEALLAALVLLILHEAGVHLSPALIATVVVILALCVLMVYRIVTTLARRRQVGGREGMIGLRGRVITPLAPEGTVKVRGEQWRARSTGDGIDANSRVVVVGVQGLTLLVRLENQIESASDGA